MSRPRPTLFACLLALAMPALLAAAPSSFEQRKAAYEQLVTQIQAYRKHLHHARWQNAHTEDFKKPDLSRWHSPSGGIGLQRSGDADVLRAHSQGQMPRRLSFKAVEVSGPYAIEVELRGDSVQAYYGLNSTTQALHVNSEGPEQPPALFIDVMRFVGRAGTTPVYYSGDFAMAGQIQARPIPVAVADVTGPMLARAENTSELKKLRTLRMEVRNGEVIHLMDGVPFHQQPLHEKFDPDKPHHPRLMVRSGSVHISRLVIEKPREGVDDAAAETEAWSKAFGDTPRARAEALAAELVADLDHNDYRVRERAQQLLRSLTDLADPAIRRAAETGSDEQRWRARALLHGRPTYQGHQGGHPIITTGSVTW